MARTARSAKLDTPSARAKLTHNKSGHWVAVTPGRGFGYRKGPKGGKWVARLIDGEKRFETVIGIADDIMDANNQDIFTFSQAQEKARGWFETASRPDTQVNPGTLTVKEATERYMAEYKAGKTKGGGTGYEAANSTVKAFILPELGDHKIAELDRKTIEAWRDKIVTSPPRRRSKAGAEIRHAPGKMTDEAIRRRRSSTNRILNTLKAILNHAYDHSRVGDREAWRAVKPFRGANAPKIRWLSNEEAKHLREKAEPDIRNLITAALLTGARYGELTNLRIRDFTAGSKSLFISKSKSGKARHIYLTDEGVTFFQELTADKQHDDQVLKRSNGALWKHSDQYRAINAASAAAEITPAIGFHILRHTYASWLAMKGVPMAVIAAQLGHADTRITEKHYAHLGPSYVAQTVRAAFEDLGLFTKT